MSQPRRKYDPEFKAGAVRIVRETRRSVAEVARELGIGAGVLGNWVRNDRVERGEAEGLTADDRAELLSELESSGVDEAWHDGIDAAAALERLHNTLGVVVDGQRSG